MAKPRILVLAAIASVGLAACGGGSTSGSAANKPDKVQIAAEGPFTGDQASIGAGALRAIQLAVKDFNKAGGVNGTRRRRRCRPRGSLIPPSSASSGR